MGLTSDDHIAIQQLVARYNHAIDGGDGETFACAFVEDGVLDAGLLVLEGRAALRSFAAGFPSSSRAPRHVTTNLLVEGDGDRAAIRAYVQLWALDGDPPRQAVRASGTYHDTLVKEGGEWRFVRRTYVGDAEAPAGGGA